MGSDWVPQPPHRLYSSFIETGEHGDLVSSLWGQVPADLMEARRLATDLRKDFGASLDGLETLKKAMKRQLRRWGILTSRIESNIDRLDQGAVEAGQQPMCLGGPSLILNKVACARRLCDIGGPEGPVPLYFVADYDEVQNELLNTWVPSLSPGGILISLPAEAELFGSPMSELANPPEAWFREIVGKIEGNYRGLLRGAEQGRRDARLLNLSHALTVLKNAYYSSEGASEWSTKVLGSLMNVEADLGVPILAFSSPDIRPLFQAGYELLLSEPNRSRFIGASNKAVEIIEGAGFRPQIGLRADDYVPFFLECMNGPCRRMRIELRYRWDPGTSAAQVTGKCPLCGEEYAFSFEARNPDLSEVTCWISPRVDSRQVVVDSVVPVLCHVGGPGETSYYAEVIPAARSLEIPFPTFIRYTRVFYNTTWNEMHAEGLREAGQPTIMSGGLFSALGRWVEARNAGSSDRLREAHRDILGSLMSTYNGLLERHHALEKEMSAIKEKLRAPGDRETLIRDLRSRLRLSHSISLYLSSAFGRFSYERFGQEVSWSWLDLATEAGVGDLLGVFLRQYSEHTPISSTFFVNL